MALLVDKLLDFAQLEAGKKSLSSEHIDLQVIVEEAVRGLARSNPERKIDLIDPPPETTTPVFVDRTAVIHCIQNLLENALKYSAPAAAVTVRTGLNDGAAFVEVADHGIGIPHADQQKIFQKFYRADNARASNVHGTGIGLALVKRIMEAHSGSVTFTSEPGKGSSFRLTFPASEVQS